MPPAALIEPTAIDAALRLHIGLKIRQHKERIRMQQPIKQWHKQTAVSLAELTGIKQLENLLKHRLPDPW